MKISQDSDNRQTTLTFAGLLDIHSANMAHLALAEAIRNYAHVAVQVMEVEALDLSFLQLICAAHRTATFQKKRFTLTVEDMDYFKALLVRCGLDRDCGCQTDPLEPCIWQKVVTAKERNLFNVLEKY